MDRALADEVAMRVHTYMGMVGAYAKKRGSSYYVVLRILARALLTCIQPGFSLSLGDLTAVFSGIMEEIEDGKNATLCVLVYFILHPANVDICVPCVFRLGLEQSTLTGYRARLFLQLDIYKYMIQILSFHL